MGVYIDMEMPGNCDKCLYSSWSNFYQIYVCNAIRKNEPVLFDKKQVKSTDTVRSGRADNCPLVSIPKHGDLIDRGYAIATACSGRIRTLPTTEDGENWIRVEEVRESIKNAPTIIPASEDGE